MPLDYGSQETTTPDTQAPEFSSGSIATNSQDASTGLAAASVEATITDAGSGFNYGSLGYSSDAAPDQQTTISLNKQNLVDGDNNNGLYTSSTTFHENAANGQWSLSGGYLRDETGNEISINADWLADHDLSSLASFELDSSNPDIIDPVLSKVSLGAAIQDPATGQFYVPVSIEASDLLSGIKDGSLQIREANSGQSASAWFAGYNGIGTGTSTDPFKTSFTLSEYAVSGNWSLTNIWLFDKAGNHISLYDSELSDFLIASSSNSTVAISNTNQDVSDPDLQAIRLITSTTDDATGRALITLELEIDEQNAGFRDGRIYLTKQGGGGSFNASINQSNLISGTLHGSGGTYRVSTQAPEGYSGGDWEISRYELYDQAGNYISAWDSETEVILANLKTAGQVVATIPLATATGGIPYQEYLSDLEAPEIDPDSFSLSYVPDSSRSGKGGTLFVDMRAWDDVSGVNYISLNFQSESGQTYTYNIDNAGAYLNLGNLDAEHNPTDEQLRGDTLNGWFRGSTSIGQYATDGTWTLRSASITDRAGNSTSIYEDRSYVGSGYFDDEASEDGFEAWGFDPDSLRFTVSNTTPENDAPDFSGLNLSSANLTSANLNRYGEARLPFTVTTADNLSGVQSIQLEYRGPNDAYAWGNASFDWGQRFISGDSRSGSTTGAIYLSSYNGTLQSGDYELASISITDRAGNRTTYRDASISGGGYFGNSSSVGSSGTDSLSDKLTSLGLNASNLAFTYTHTATGGGTSADTTAPTISAIQAWPYQTNKPAAIGLGDQQNALPIRVSATDASGISNISFGFSNSLYGDSWSTNLSLSDRNMTQGSTIRNGEFEGSILLNEYAQEGRWKLDYINISDIAGNRQNFWGLQNTNSNGALTQEALDQRAALAALGLEIDALSFVAGDFVEPESPSVTRGSQISFDVYGMNQQANTTLYWSANIIGSSIKPSGTVSLDALKQGTFILDTSELGSFGSDKKVFIDLWQDANRYERVGEAASFTLKAPVISGGGGGGGGGGAPSTPTPPVAITPPSAQPPAAPPVPAPPLPETAKEVLQEIFADPKAPPTTEQWTELATTVTSQLPELVAAGSLTETSAGVLQALADGSVVDAATRTSNKGIPVKVGGDTDDVITGNAGKGVLVGGNGADAFSFIEQDRFGKRGSDRITDFKPTEGDKIVISPAAFPGLDTFKFTSINGRDGLKKALRSEATIIYIEETGELYYNGKPGKNGKGAGGLFAVLNDRPQIGADSFDLLDPSTLLG